jgi:hypothetical protein
MKNKSLITAGFTLLFLPTIASAAVTIENVGSSLGLGSADLKQTVLNVVSFVLGLLGLIAVAMILYGFFTLLTSSGSEDKASFAKRVITSAMIGLVVILISWAIVNFVLKTTTQVTS